MFDLPSVFGLVPDDLSSEGQAEAPGRIASLFHGAASLVQFGWQSRGNGRASRRRGARVIARIRLTEKKFPSLVRGQIKPPLFAATHNSRRANRLRRTLSTKRKAASGILNNTFLPSQLPKIAVDIIATISGR